MESAAIKALRQQFNSKLTEAKTLNDKEDATPDELKRAGELATEAQGIKAQIEAAGATSATLDALKTWDETPATGLPQPGAAVKSESTLVGKTQIDLFTGKVEEEGAGLLTDSQVKATLDPNYTKAFRSLMRAGGRIEHVKDKEERKSLMEGIDADGGQLVPAQVIAGILRRDPAPTRILDYIRTITVSSDKAQMLRSVYNSDDLYSSAVRVYPTAEGGEAPVTGKPQFGTFNIDIHQYIAEMSISRNLLEDEAFGLIPFITEEFRTAHRNHAASKVLTGSGVGEHFGILTRAGKANGPEVVKSGDANNVTWTGLRKIKNAVPEQYDQNARYVFNKRSTQDAIEALVDGDGRPLWPESQRSGLEHGTPGTLQGYGYLREAFMPDVAPNAFPYLFGDLMGYIRAIRLGMTIEPYRELEARRGMVVFLARFREGGDVAEPWRLRAGKIAA